MMVRIVSLALALVIALAAFAAGSFAAHAQSAKTLREQLVGTWSFVIADITTADGKKTFPFGERPKGMLIFTADGHFSQVHVSGDLPKIASNNRLAGTDADRGQGKKCLIAVCVTPQCTTEADCKTTQSCVFGQCVAKDAPPPSPGQCQSKADCADGLSCVLSACVPLPAGLGIDLCTGGQACPPGKKCQFGTLCL